MDDRKLRFGADGSFSVMQVSDVQDTRGLRPRTKELLITALDRERPDFVVLSGDQIKGYGLSLLFGSREKKHARITRTMDELLDLLEERDIPFTFTFGNHDHDAPMDPLAQVRWYQRRPLCLGIHDPDVPGYANHAIPVAGSRSDDPALLFYFLDSHGPSGTGYTPLDPAQVAWYRSTRDAYGRVPSMLFMHVPVEEIIELYREVPKRTPGAYAGFRNYQGKYFVLDKDKTAPGGSMGEMPSSPDENAGLFEAAREKGEMAGMFFGHDHTNAFEGDVRGIRLGYTPGVGFATYGPGRQRGVRMFRFDEQDAKAFQTYVVTYEDLLPGKSLGLEAVFWDKTPSSFATAKPMVIRALAAVLPALTARILAAALGGLSYWPSVGIGWATLAAILAAFWCVRRLRKKPLE